jgi:hypothetical protein
METIRIQSQLIASQAQQIQVMNGLLTKSNVEIANLSGQVAHLTRIVEERLLMNQAMTPQKRKQVPTPSPSKDPTSFSAEDISSSKRFHVEEEAAPGSSQLQSVDISSGVKLDSLKGINLNQALTEFYSRLLGDRVNLDATDSR